MAVLESGGNAFDAAVAAGFVLQVVEPHYNGPGGDLSVVLYSSATGKTAAVCGQGPMPGAATLERFRELGLGQIPGSGLLPATVPGAFGGWMRLLAEFGTMRLRDVLTYGIEYAERGFPLLPTTTEAIATLAPLFASEWTGSASIYLPGGKAPGTGTRFRNPALARTYRRIIDLAEATSTSREAQIQAAQDAFYRGFVAEAIDTFTAGTEAIDATGRRHRSFLTGQDLANWEPTVEEALGVGYRGHLVYKPAAWSQGPVFLQQLALLEGFDLAGMGLGSAEYLHTVVECAKLAFADREAWYGDPLHSDVPLQTLLSADYNRARRELVTKEAADALRPGAPDGRDPWMPTPGKPDLQPGAEDWISQLGNGLPTILPRTAARGDTCTVTVTDRAGNTVAATPSGGWLKSSPVIGELGFPLGTRGQTMWLVDGHPNSVAPGRRPRTTLSPTVVVKDDGSVLSFGTPGGDRQDQWTLLFLLGVIDFGLDSQSATESLAFHSDAVPASFTPRESHPRRLTVERNCDAEVVDELLRRNHDVQLVAENSLGNVCASGRDATTGFSFASASPRKCQAYAVSR